MQFEVDSYQDHRPDTKSVINAHPHHHTHTILAVQLTYHRSAAIVDSSPLKHDQRWTTVFNRVLL